MSDPPSQPMCARVLAGFLRSREWPRTWAKSQDFAQLLRGSAPTFERPHGSTMLWMELQVTLFTCVHFYLFSAPRTIKLLLAISGRWEKTLKSVVSHQNFHTSKTLVTRGKCNM